MLEAPAPPGAMAGEASLAPAASWGRAAAETALLCGAYLAAGKLGLSLAVVNANVTPVWPPTGIALAAVLMLGSRALAGVLLGAFLVNATTSGSLLASAAIAVGNTLEAFVGAWLLSRWGGGRRALARPSGVFAFAVAAGALAPAVGATCGAASLWAAGLLGTGGAWPVWQTWWLGDGAGALVVAPVLLSWDAPSRGAGRLGELGAMAVGLAAVAAAVFAGPLPFDFLCMPPLLWAAFRFGRRETAAACLGLCAYAVWATAARGGPFARPDANESLMLLQGFVAVSTVAALTVAALVEERREAERALEAARAGLEVRVLERTAELVRSNEDLDRFAAVAAHELQEPVRKLQMFGDLLKPGVEATAAEREEFVGRMQDAARRMGRLVSDILRLARTRGEARAFERVDLGLVAVEAAEELEAAAGLEAGWLDLEPLPAVQGDAGQLKSLLANLLSNAAKFRRPGVPLKVRVSSRPSGDGFVDIDVADNGIGFDMAHAARIFEPFQRLHRRTDYEGSGLGLTLCARIAAGHGGAVRVRSTPGEGSVFTVSLPTGGGG